MATCIGSGFATGAECLSFFVTYGIKGALGALALSFIIYFLFTKELFNKGQELPEEQRTSLFTCYFGRLAGNLLDWFSAILVGGCYLIMLSGAGTTIHQYLGLPVVAGSAIMAAAAVITVWFGLRRLTRIIGAIGPVVAVFTIVIGIYALTKADFSATESALNSLNYPKAAPNWAISGILYPCFCMLTLTPSLPSMGASAPNRRTTTAAAAIGVVFFHVALCLAVFAILGNLDIVGAAQVPNLALSGMLGSFVQGLFVVMIILAIYSTACPMMWGFCGKVAKDEDSAGYKISILALTVIGTVCSYLFPLSTLINFIYGISG
ncbi:MAG: hypothetical protein HUJ66_03920 [Oscillospiraceae bacterium]|nr:hypothetical protein [Oscillospiraceae bacterium]